MTRDDLNILDQCVDFTLKHNSDAEKEILGKLDVSAATPFLRGLRVLRMQRALLAIGMFSLFESLLKAETGWHYPFQALDKKLRDKGNSHLASTISDYKNAINVLKHGDGASYNRLLARGDLLEFTVRRASDAFFEEGDTSEVNVLVDVDDRFVRRCAELIGDVLNLICVDEDK